MHANSVRSRGSGASQLAGLLRLALVLALAGCANGPGSGSRSGASGGGDGPPREVPDGLSDLEDAQPRVEAIREGGPNKPYEVMGVRYQPFTHDRPFIERGLASWYGRKFHGRPTANGETYDMFAMTAAHPTLPLPSYVRVRNPANGREVVVRVNDRGPFHRGRIIDLSYAAAHKLDLLRGVAPVEVERLTPQAIRDGSWKRRGAQLDSPDGGASASPSPDTTGATPPARSGAGEIDESPALPADAASAALPLPLPLLAEQTPGFWLQLGAYRQRDGAESFRRRVAAEVTWLAERLAVFSDQSLFRLQAGPYASRDEAQLMSERLRSALQLVPLMQERR
jgi:rare lipoprotein A